MSDIQNDLKGNADMIRFRLEKERDEIVKALLHAGKTTSESLFIRKQEIEDQLADDAEMGGLSSVADKYNELLYAVATKHPGETRHETALRYIREAEKRCNGPECLQKEKTDADR